MPRSSRMPSRLAATAALLAAVGSGCGRAPAPDVLLVVLDTVRADHLSGYGYPLPTSPHLDALARGADRHANARASAPWTLPSHASLFTGLAPFEHGAEARRDPATRAVVDAPPLREDVVTLAEAFAAQGYETRGVVANPVYLGARSGLAQGFESWDVLALGENDWRRVTHQVFARLRDRDPARPLFLFVNLMDAHRPYNVSSPQRMWLPAADPADPAALLDALHRAVMLEGGSGEELARRVVTQYDTGIANADRGLGALLARFGEGRGGLDAALVVVTSDHGEYLGEHGLVEHSKDVYEPALRVPLVLKRPGQTEGRDIGELVSLTDLPRLLADALPAPLGARIAATFPAPASPNAIAELRYTRPKDLSAPYGKRFDRIRTAFYDDGWKLIRSSDGAHELYDLRADPAEARNRFGDAAARAAHMREQLERQIGAREYRGPWPAAPAPTAAEQEALRALGYVEP